MSDPDKDLTRAEHQALRELLGSYALGHLTGADAATCRAHLEGCAECRGELAEIAPLTALLSRLDQTSIQSMPPAPPVGLGAAIRSQVAAERASHVAVPRRTSGWRVGLVAAVVLAIVGLSGVVIGRGTAPEPPTVPREDITLTAAAEGSPVTVEDAFLVPHTWGVELRFEATGFAEGKVFKAAFRDERGRWVPAGEFIGVGADPMLCNLQASALREDVTEVAVLDAKGEVVLSAAL